MQCDALRLSESLVCILVKINDPAAIDRYMKAMASVCRRPSDKCFKVSAQLHMGLCRIGDNVATIAQSLCGCQHSFCGPGLSPRSAPEIVDIARVSLMFREVGDLALCEPDTYQKLTLRSLARWPTRGPLSRAYRLERVRAVARSMLQTKCADVWTRPASPARVADEKKPGALSPSHRAFPKWPLVLANDQA
jgi:hypothetical protein